jgi:drug/metabolite transporter (DMT)-like permease
VTIISILVFGQFPDEYSILGTCIVIGSGLYIWHRETKERRKVS